MADLGQVYLLKGRTEDAESMLRRAVELDPCLGNVHFNLGRLYEDLGEIGRAAESYTQAVMASPGTAVYWYQLANTLERIPGREAEARNAWGQVVELLGKDQTQMEMRMDALKRMERLGPAGPHTSD
jgi:predicted Zn-dependent protease